MAVAAERTRAGQVRLDNEGELRYIFDHAPVLIWVSDSAKRGVYFNEGWLAFTGRSLEQELGEGWLEGIHPDDLRRVAETCRGAFDRREPFQMEFRMRRADGMYRWVRDHGVPRFDELGQFAGYIGSCVDVTDRRLAEEALRASEAQHRELSGRLRLLLETTSRLIESLQARELLRHVLDLSRKMVEADAFGVWRVDQEGTWKVVSSEGLSDEFLRESLRAARDVTLPAGPVVVQPEDVADRSTPLLRDRFARYECEGIRSLMILPLRIHGELAGTLVFYCRSPHRFSEIEVESARALANVASAAITMSELYEAQLRLRRNAEETALRETFLAAAGAIFSESLDYEQTLANVARAAVPGFADWCGVDLLDDQGVLRRLAVAHVDPAKVALARALHEKYPPEDRLGVGVLHVIRTGKPELMEEIPDALLARGARDEDHLRILRDLRLTSYVCVPLRAGGRICGAITFVAAESGRRFEDRHLAVAEEVARRAGQAIDNARLYENLLASERRFRLMADAAPVMIWISGPDKLCTWFNKSWLAFTGRTVGEEVGRTWTDDVHTEDLDRCLGSYAAAFDRRQPFRMEYRFRRRDGEYRWVLNHGLPLYAAAGEFAGYIGSCIDITDRKQAEEALRRHAEEMQTLLDTLPIGVLFAHDPECRRITGNRASQEMLRMPAVANLSKSAPAAERPAHFRVLQNGVELPADQLPVQRAARGEQVRQEEVDHVFDDGSGTNILISAAPLRDGAGRARGAVASMLDITHRKRAEEALRVRARQQQAVANLGEYALRERDLQKLLDYAAAMSAGTLEVEYCNVLELLPGGDRMFLRAGVGWSAGLVGEAVIDSVLDSPAGYTLRSNAPVVVADLLAEKRFTGQALLLEHGVASGMSCVIHGTGARPWGVFGLYTARQMNFTQDDVSFLIAVANILGNAIHREQAEGALRRSEARKTAMFQTALDCILTIDHRGRILEFNPAAEQTFAYRRDEVLGRELADLLLPPAPQDAHGQNVTRYLGPKGGPVLNQRIEMAAVRADGTQFPVELAMTGIPGEDPPLFTIYLRDITERKRAQGQLEASVHEKEVMLREIHHRVKNNLQVISSLIDLQAGNLADPGLRAVFGDMSDRVRAMSVVHERLYNEGNLAEVDFAAYADSLLGTLWRAHGDVAGHARLRLELEPLTLPVEPAIPLGLILNELASNTLKHAFGGRDRGEVTVRLGHDPETGRVCLTVRDDGVGLPLELDWRRPATLGLRLVQMLVRQLQGTLDLNRDQGTEFRVTFTRGKEE
jgi:PAS domain S-box-containing protein